MRGLPPKSYGVIPAASCGGSSLSRKACVRCSDVELGAERFIRQEKEKFREEEEKEIMVVVARQTHRHPILTSEDCELRLAKNRRKRASWLIITKILFSLH